MTEASENTAKAANLRIAHMHEALLRKHAAAPEMGLYVVLEKTESSASHAVT